MNKVQLKEVIDTVNHLRTHIRMSDAQILEDVWYTWRAHGYRELLALRKRGLSLAEIIVEMLRRQAEAQAKEALLEDPFGDKRN